MEVGSYQGPRQRLFALRGAVQAGENSREAILSATTEVMRTMIERNSLQSDDMVSCIFTTTADLDAEFPAVAARQLGLDTVPLLCTREIPVPGSMERVIRVMLHYYAAAEAKPVHVYVGATQALRADLNAAQ
jgi:chorismate mutase